MFLFTTKIYRAELPVEDVENRAHSFKEAAQIRVPVYLNTPQQFILMSTQGLLDEMIAERYALNEWGIDVRILGGEKIDPLKDYVVNYKHVGSRASGSTEYFKLSPFSKEITIEITDADVEARRVESLTLSVLLDHVFKNELIAVSAILKDKKVQGQTDIVFPYASTYNVVFNLFSENGKTLNWDIENAVKELSPVFEALKHFASFKISTQIQYYTKLQNPPRYDEDNKANIIPKEDLSTFINYGDWNLITHDINPSINFLVYFPESNYDGTPLLVEDSKTNSFLVLQWGGVYIYNSPMPILTGRAVNFSSKELAPIFEIFTSQLFELLGVPRTPKSPRMRIDSLHRMMTLKNLKKSLDNLTSLIKLSNSLNEISIPESTRAHVLDALNFYDESIQSLSKDNNFTNAIEYSSRSVESSDKAFFEKEMVQQAHFPSEHKLAVFLPLLGPVSSIIIIGLIKALKDMKNDKKELKEEEKTKKEI